MRFAGYIDNYRTCKLVDISEIVTRTNENNSEYPIMMISAGKGFIAQSEKYSRDNAGTSINKYILLKKGELAYNRGNSKQFPYGAIYEMKEECALIPYVYHCFNIYDESTRYFSHYLNSPFKDEQLSKIITSSVRGNGLLNISKNDFFNLSLNVPSIKEQNKIAKFLDLIDQRIQTQSKIISDYNSLKRGITQCIFNTSQQHSSVHLKVILKEISRKNKNRDNNNILSVSNSLGFIKQSEQFEDREIASSDTSNYKIINKNEYAYNPARINVGSIARLQNFDCGIVSPMYTIFTIDISKITYEYFDLFLQSSTFQKQLSQKLEGSVRQCLTFASMQNILIKLPPLETQIEISGKMKFIDSKIKLESDYLNLLQSEKNYLLKNLFI